MSRPWCDDDSSGDLSFGEAVVRRTMGFRDGVQVFRAAAFVLVMVLIAGTLAGCGEVFQHGMKATAEDDRRLEVITADPILADAVIRKAGLPLDTNINAIATRGQLNGSEQTGIHIGDQSQRLWDYTKAQLRRFTDSGWNVTAIKCSSNGIIWINALKDYGDFTAALAAGVHDDEDNRGYALFEYWATIPFHSEGADPWDPSQPVATPTCMDSVAPPAALTIDEDDSYFDSGFTYYDRYVPGP